MASRIKGITVEIDGSTTGLDKALKGTTSNISKTQSALKDVNRLLKVDPKNTELLAQKQKLLSQAIEETKEKLEIEKTALEQAANTDMPPDKMDALKREVIAHELERLEQEARETAGSLGKTMQAAGQRLKDVGDKTVAIGKGFSTHVTAPIAAIGAASIAAFNEVDAGMDIIEQKTGAAGKALTEMENSAKKIATEIPTDFEAAGAAIGEVNTRFGLTGKSLEDLSAKFIKFADLNGTDVSNSIDNTQKVLSAFGLTAEDAGALLDTMNAVGQRTGISMDDLASSMVTNSASLQQMGFSAADAANFLGNVEMSGADASQVMSGLTKALANATAEGKPMNTALAEIQQSSDLTYRVYDYGRTDADGHPRALHIASALRALDYRPCTDLHTHPDRLADGAQRISECQHFNVDRVEIHDGKPLAMAHNPSSFRVVMCVDGEIVLTDHAGRHKATLPCGFSALVPAANEGLTLSGNATALIASV